MASRTKIGVSQIGLRVEWVVSKDQVLCDANFRACMGKDTTHRRLASMTFGDDSIMLCVGQTRAMPEETNNVNGIESTD
jgi:hypothetical protein